MMLPCIELSPGSKVPPAGRSWPENVSLDPADHARWIAKGKNIGLETGTGITVVDVDNKEMAREFYRARKSILSVIVETRKGAHFWFAGEGPTRKLPDGDLKGVGGYVVMPPSVVDGWTYRYVDGHGIERLDELKPYPTDIVPERRGITRGEVKNVREYVAKVESIQGRNGSADLVRAAAICRDGNIPPSEAVLILLEWNASGKAIPPWPAEDIARAITNVYSKGA